MRFGRFAYGTAPPLGGVDLGRTHPPFVFERGAQLAVLGLESPGCRPELSRAVWHGIMG